MERLRINLLDVIKGIGHSPEKLAEAIEGKIEDAKAAARQEAQILALKVALEGMEMAREYVQTQITRLENLPP